MNRLCDTHVHVFDPGRFPYAANRKFTPDTATVDQLKKHLDAIGADSVVLVQPSVYGTDHTCLIDALQSLGKIAKGIAVIDHSTSNDAIEALDRAGVVGARINMVVNNNSNVDLAISAIQDIELRAPKQWHIQLHVSLGVLDELHDHIAKSPRYFVIDHFGLPNVTEGIDSPQWQRLLQLLKTDRLFVKTSAPYLSSKQTTQYRDLQPFVDSLIQTNPQRVLWGTNWPHTKGTKRNASTPITEVEVFRVEDDSSWNSLCLEWANKNSVELAFLNASFLYEI
jgi:predicted TIM-barrel fold metal-dependent hydrolase